MKPEIFNRLERTFQSFSKRNAFCIKDQYYTYNQLIEKVASIQHSIENEVKKPCVIGVFTEDTIETYASILAIWLTGHTFVPLNPSNPIIRNQEIIDDAGIKLILTGNSFFCEKIDERIKTINTSDVKPNSKLIIQEVDNNALAYILFTSGSTGKPKGVQISWKNLDSFLDSYYEIIKDINEDDRFLQMFDFSFDGSIMSYLPALCIGACSYSVPLDNIKFLKVIEILEEKEITVGLIVPSVISFLKPYFNEIKLEKFKYCIVGAEASYNNIMNQWQECVPNGKIYNFYGPTESTVFCLSYYYNLTEKHDKSYNGIICLGRSTKNMEVRIADPITNQFLQVGQKGEIVISGSQLTKGYLNNPKNNQEAFFNYDQSGIISRWYKTGDEGFIDQDGDFFYCGRIDNQIQIQGFRVELSEIEYPVRKHFNIDNLIAIERKDSNHNSEIFLFVEKFDGNTSEIMELLKKLIPWYMIPSGIINLPSLPITTNGKIDRKALVHLLDK